MNVYIYVSMCYEYDVFMNVCIYVYACMYLINNE